MTDLQLYFIAATFYDENQDQMIMARNPYEALTEFLATIGVDDLPALIEENDGREGTARVFLVTTSDRVGPLSWHQSTLQPGAPGGFIEEVLSPIVTADLIEWYRDRFDENGNRIDWQRMSDHHGKLP